MKTDIQAVPAAETPRRFLAVFHQWHVDSRGFDWQVIEAADAVSANQEAAAELVDRNRRNFAKSDYCLVEIGQDMPLEPRRLTWRERLTGRLQA